MAIPPTPTTQQYRDRIYIVEDIILKLVEYGELNQTALISFSGLNLKKHRCILDELEVNGLIQKGELPVGKRTIIVYKPTQKGVEFCRNILQPYERMFPRRKESSSIIPHLLTSTSTAATTSTPPFASSVDAISNNNNNNNEKIPSARKPTTHIEGVEQQKQEQELRPMITSEEQLAIH